jgi:hypothetical protein
MTKVEEIFTKHFADHDRRKVMAQLRPLQQRGGHSVTFLLGMTNIFIPPPSKNIINLFTCTGLNCKCCMIFRRVCK